MVSIEVIAAGVETSARLVVLPADEVMWEASVVAPVSCEGVCDDGGELVPNLVDVTSPAVVV